MPDLLTPADLHTRLGTDDSLRLVQVTSPQVFASAHIAGSIHVAPRELVSGIPPATGQLPSDDDLTALFRRIGHATTHHYVVIDDEGGGWAGRFAWTLDAIGHHTWSYLDGGLHAWHGAGLPLTQDDSPIAPSACDIDVDPSFRLSVDDMLRELDDPDVQVWDCRSYEEYTGERVSAARGGHIPGATHLDWLDLMDNERHLSLQADLAEFVAGRGIDRDKNVIAHCQTHHRSGLAYMVGRILSFGRIRAYHGSWSEWGNHPDTPIKVGADP